MIQRIQSIWLFISTLLFGLEYWQHLSFAHTLSAGPGILDDMLLKTSENQYMTTGSILSSILSFVAIFLYRNRGSQVMIAGLSSLVQLVLNLGFGFYLIYKYGMINQFRPDLTAYFGWIGLFANWLAIKAIRKDIEVVKSMDRLR